MLNYVWLGLLMLGVGIALTTDLIESNSNKYRNGEKLPAEIVFSDISEEFEGKSYEVVINIESKIFNDFYNENLEINISQPATITFNPEKQRFLLFFTVNDDSPSIWSEMAKISGKEDDLTGEIFLGDKLSFSTFRGDIIFEEISFAHMKEVTNSALDYAGIAVEIAIGLIGIMALWLGVMKVAEEAGLIRIIAGAVKPLTKFLFPDVPQDHPAMGAMIMNMAANMLGLGNAATPFGLKAMEELDKLNPKKGVATNAMCTFLAVNTAGLTLIPATAIAIRAASGSSDPAIIIGTAIFGALCATTVGITATKIMEKFPLNKEGISNLINSNKKGLSVFAALLLIVFILLISGLMSSVISFFNFLSPELFKNLIQIISTLAIPMLIFIFIGYGAIKKVKIYEVFVEGAKEGFDVAVRIIPYLVMDLLHLPML